MYNEHDEEVRSIARCSCCEELIYDDNEEVYMDEYGHYFCCLDCALQHHGIMKSEDYMG